MKTTTSNETSEISSLTSRDLRWFATPARARRALDGRRPSEPAPPIGDPLADRWFR
jgi:hypothetical protein